MEAASEYYAGLDLGQVRDFSALAVVEATPTRHAIDYTGRDSEMGLPMERLALVQGPPLGLALRGLERYELGTSYPAIVGHVAGRVRDVPGAVTLALDATGVGAAVADLFHGVGVPIAAVTITNGETARRDGSKFWVPKRDLVHGLLVALQEGRFTYATRLTLAPALVKELAAFRLKVSTGGHDSYEAWREGDHDDLVLAVAVACWLAEQATRAAYADALAAIEGETYTRATDVRISPY